MAMEVDGGDGQENRPDGKWLNRTKSRWWRWGGATEIIIIKPIPARAKGEMVQVPSYHISCPSCGPHLFHIPSSIQQFHCSSRDNFDFQWSMGGGGSVELWLTLVEEGWRRDGSGAYSA